MTGFPDRLFCDTSLFYAALDASDANHEDAGVLVADAARESCELFTTWDIVSETSTLLRYRKSLRTAKRFLVEIKPQLRIVRYGDGIRSAAETVFLRYGADHRLSLCDALSFVVVKTLLDDMTCAAFDEDFRTLGLTVIP